MRKNRTIEQSSYSRQRAKAIAESSQSAGDFTVFVGTEGINTGIGMNMENSKRYADVTRIAIRELYPELIRPDKQLS